METWQFYFMMGTGVYLIFFGGLMFKSKKHMSAGVGIYNMVMGIASIVAAILGKNISSIANKVSLIFIVVLVVSFLGFSMLNLLTKKR